AVIGAAESAAEAANASNAGAITAAEMAAISGAAKVRERGEALRDGASDRAVGAGIDGKGQGWLLGDGEGEGEGIPVVGLPRDVDAPSSVSCRAGPSNRDELVGEGTDPVVEIAAALERQAERVVRFSGVELIRTLSGTGSG
ncbi:unnamed protein product, partial [Discosporangium mesarthrocarpum]